MNPARLARTLQHVTVGQATARLRHELWLRTRRNRGWELNESLRMSTGNLPLPKESLSRFAKVVDLWQRGRVEYVGIEGGNADWRGEGKPKLWGYERQYHSELVALAARSLEEPHGPWILAAREMQDEWARACPPELGDAWEPYPVARRILSWAEAAALEPSICAPQMAARLAVHLKHLSLHIEHHLRGNHLLCDAAALVAGGAMLEGEIGAVAMHLGADLLERELNAQVLKDGGYAERTVQYHALVLRDALLAVELSRARKANLRDRLGKQLSKMALWLWRSQRFDGTWPLVNDAGPEAFPIAQETLARATRMQLYSQPTAAHTIELAQTGWSYLRDASCELFFDCGLIGPKEQPGHGHDDALSYELRWFGLPVVTDSGVTTYERDETRAFERSASAHATISVDGFGIDEVWAAFRVGARGTVEKLPQPANLDPRLSVLRGRARSHRGFVHERTLVFWPARALLVFDRVLGAPSTAKILSHVPLDPSWSAAEAEGALFLLGPGARGLQLHIVKGALEKLARGETSPRDGWVGEGFGKPVARTSVSLRASSGGQCLYAIVAPGVGLRQTAKGIAFRSPGAVLTLPLEGLEP